MPTPDEIKTIKSTLKKFEKAKRLQKQLATLEAELKSFGLKLPKVKAERLASVEPVKRTPIDEAKVIEFIGNKEVGYPEVAVFVGKGEQTVKKWLDGNKKISKRNEDPKNKKSKVLYKVK
jgi:(p)ppGpp synthase/HD superfamily hydrolase